MSQHTKALQLAGCTPGAKLGSGFHAYVYTAPENTVYVIGEIRANFIKRVTYDYFDCLFDVHVLGDTQILHVKRLVTESTNAIIDHKIHTLVDLFNRISKIYLDGPVCYRRDWVSNTLLDIATHPDVPGYLQDWAQYLCELGITFTMFDNFSDNWLYDPDTHLCYPIDVVV